MDIRYELWGTLCSCCEREFDSPTKKRDGALRAEIQDFFNFMMWSFRDVKEDGIFMYEDEISKGFEEYLGDLCMMYVNGSAFDIIRYNKEDIETFKKEALAKIQQLIDK